MIDHAIAGYVIIFITVIVIIIMCIIIVIVMAIVIFVIVILNIITIIKSTCHCYNLLSSSSLPSEINS